MTEADKTGESKSAPKADSPLVPTKPPPVPTSASEAPFVMEDREKKLVIHMERKFEQRMISILRQESGDSYGGLPADHVLVNLNDSFPEVNFPARMMSRLEAEQEARIEREKREDQLDLYEAQTRRMDAEADRDHLNRAANRAVLVLVLLLIVGFSLTVLGHPVVGGTVLGTTLVGVIGAFLSQRLGKN